MEAKLIEFGRRSLEQVLVEETGFELVAGGVGSSEPGRTPDAVWVLRSGSEEWRFLVELKSTLWPSGVAAMAAQAVVLKALTFENRQADKDAYDLWYVLAHAKEGPLGIGEKLLPHVQDAEVAGAPAFLRVAFESAESVGPVAVARFQEASGEDAERVAAQAYAVVQMFLRGLPGGGE